MTRPPEPDQTEDKQEKGGQNIEAHASTLSKYEGSQPLGDMVRLVYILYHLVDQNNVEHHTPPKLLDREEFPRLVLRIKEPDPSMPYHAGTTEHLEDESTKTPDDTTTKLQPTGPCEVLQSRPTTCSRLIMHVTSGQGGGFGSRSRGRYDEFALKK